MPFAAMVILRSPPMTCHTLFNSHAHAIFIAMAYAYNVKACTSIAYKPAVYTVITYIVIALVHTVHHLGSRRNISFDIKPTEHSTEHSTEQSTEHSINSLTISWKISREGSIG